MTSGLPAQDGAPASLLRRLAAAAYDLLLLAGLLVASAFLIVIARHGQAVPAGHPLFQCFLATEILAYFAGFWRWGGQTPGMRVWQLRLVSRGGGTVSLSNAVLRLLCALLSAAAAGVGFLAALADPTRRTWHDRMSGTRVVHLPAAKRGRGRDVSARG